MQLILKMRFWIIWIIIVLFVVSVVAYLGQSHAQTHDKGTHIQETINYGQPFFKGGGVILSYRGDGIILVEGKHQNLRPGKIKLVPRKVHDDSYAYYFSFWDGAVVVNFELIPVLYGKVQVTTY